MSASSSARQAIKPLTCNEVSSWLPISWHPSQLNPNKFQAKTMAQIVSILYLGTPGGPANVTVEVHFSLTARSLKSAL
jgi:hypothetical protein